MQPCVYIMTNQRNGTLYIGVTNLIQRVWQHQHGATEGFTIKHGLHMLVWYELHASMESAISLEKALKFWKRIAKLRIIEQMNPDWLDLYREIAGLDSGLRQNDGH